MVVDPLMTEDVEAGQALIALLDSSGMEPQAAFWLYRSDTERWRLVIVRDEARGDVRDLYLRAIDAGASRDFDLAHVDFQPPENRFVRAVNQGAKVSGIGRVRLRDRIGDDGTFIEDALVYRTAA